MKSAFSFILPGLFLFSACQPSSHGPASLSLSDQSIYEYDSVRLFLAGQQKGKKQTQKLFLEAVDKYRNKKQPEAAIPIFVQSITEHPTAKAYYELGNAAADARHYDQALKAYHMAELLKYKPMSKLLYNTACVLSLKNNPEEGLKYLEYAIEAGYTNADNIAKDADLANLRKEDRFSQVVNQALGGASDPETIQWLSFKRSFASASLPVTLDKETVVPQEDNFISFDYEKFVPEMRTVKFSREVSKEFYYYASVTEQSNYTALLYAVKDRMMGDKAPMNFVLASFNSKGVLIDKKLVSGQEYLDKNYLVCTIKPNLSFAVQEYKLNYEKDPAEEGYYDNNIVSTELKNTRFYVIDETGKFKEEDMELSMR